MTKVQPFPGYELMPTTEVIDRGILPPNTWVAVPEKDGWLVPEAEYWRIVGRVN